MFHSQAGDLCRDPRLQVLDTAEFVRGRVSRTWFFCHSLMQQNSKKCTLDHMKLVYHPRYSSGGTRRFSWVLRTRRFVGLEIWRKFLLRKASKPAGGSFTFLFSRFSFFFMLSTANSKQARRLHDFFLQSNTHRLWYQTRQAKVWRRRNRRSKGARIYSSLYFIFFATILLTLLYLLPLYIL
jgi:hypothetical protein